MATAIRECPCEHSRSSKIMNAVDFSGIVEWNYLIVMKETYSNSGCCGYKGFACVDLLHANIDNTVCNTVVDAGAKIMFI